MIDDLIGKLILVIADQLWSVEFFHKKEEEEAGTVYNTNTSI